MSANLNVTSLADAAVSSGTCDATEWAQPIQQVTAYRWTRLDRTIERGMATAEYAVGILAAVALALLLLKVFTDNSFFTTVLKFVTNLIGKAGGLLP